MFDNLMAAKQQQRSAGETSSPSGSSLCSSPNLGPPAELVAAAQQRSFNNQWNLKQRADEHLLLFRELIEQSDECSSDEDQHQHRRAAKRSKQSSETSVLMMMQHLTRRRNELKIIDERLLNMMNSCLDRLDCGGGGDCGSGSEPDCDARAGREEQQPEVQQVAVDLSMLSCNKRHFSLHSEQQASKTSSSPRALHPKKVRLLGAIREPEAAECQQVAWLMQQQQDSALSLATHQPARQQLWPARSQANQSAASQFFDCHFQFQQPSAAPLTTKHPFNQEQQQFQFGAQQPTPIASFCSADESQAASSLFVAYQPAPPSDQQPLQSAARLQRTGGATTANQLDHLMKCPQLATIAQAPGHQQQVAGGANLASDLIMPIVQKMSSFRCHVCHSCFEDRHRLQQHLSIHLSLHPSWFEETTIKETMAQYELRRGDYLCQVCQLRYETTADFDRHMQLHGEKPHYCELCQQANNKLVSFRYFRQLLTHLRSHCFLYSCKFAPDCKQTANRKDYLKLHILKHHLNNRLPEQHTICCH